MRIEDLNWMDVEKYLNTDDRLILVIGSTEEHGYLSLTTDVRIPLALADSASKQTGVLVAPAMNYGVSPYFQAYPGTFSLRVTTLLAMIEDVIRSGYVQGFRRFLVLNGHGGNEPARAVLYELANELEEMHAFWYDWWKTPVVEEISAKYGLSPRHANWQEAFPFTRVTEELPEDHKPFLPRPAHIMNAAQVREYYGDGSFGGQYQADDAVMHEIFASCLREILELLKFE
jgi:creatinine amidohydrolase